MVQPLFGGKMFRNNMIVAEKIYLKDLVKIRIKLILRNAPRTNVT